MGSDFQQALIASRLTGSHLSATATVLAVLDDLVRQGSDLDLMLAYANDQPAAVGVPEQWASALLAAIAAARLHAVGDHSLHPLVAEYLTTSPDPGERWIAAMYEQLPEATVRRLAADPNVWVRVAVARRKSAPAGGRPQRLGPGRRGSPQESAPRGRLRRHL